MARYALVAYRVCTNSSCISLISVINIIMQVQRKYLHFLMTYTYIHRKYKMTQFVIVLADTLNASAIAEAIAAPFKAIKKLTRTLGEHIQQERLVNSTIKELSKLSDRELNDIGISRGMIRSVAMDANR